MEGLSRTRKNQKRGSKMICERHKRIYGDTCPACADEETCDGCCYCELEMEGVEEFVAEIPAVRLGM